MVDQSHLSIGEVLTLLQDEHPDVTISKIRFLESQGLLDPERTPSGYRKFYSGDIERLRWILQQQKDNFLPLKVIKERLASGRLDEPVAAETPAVEEPAHDTPAPKFRKPPSRTREPVAVGELDLGSSHSRSGGVRRGRARAGAPGVPRQRPRREEPLPSLFAGDDVGVNLTRDEVLTSTGLDPKDLAELEKFGLVESRSLGGTSYYDEEALLVATLAAGFLGHGIEARHLRMFKVAAEREAGMLEQLVMPLLKQRNPRARAQATERLDELADLGARLRDAMLRMALHDHLGPG